MKTCRRLRGCVAVVLAALAGLPQAVAGQSVPAGVADGVFVLRGGFDPGRQPDGNSVIFAGPRGLVVVDTGRHAAHTQALLDFAAARGQPIALVINTHWHLDHLGGNALLRARVPGLTIIASNAVAPALSGWLAESRRDMQALLDSGRADDATRSMLRIDIALIDAGPRLLPDLTLDAPRAVDGAGKPLQIGLARDAVTGADLWVYDPATGVVAAGDLVTLPVPFLDTACAPRWSDALGQLEALPFLTLVPGHGAPMTRAAFATWRQAFDGLLACAAGDRPAAACADGWIAGLGPLLPPAEHRRTRAMVDDYLGEHLRAPAAQRERFCPVPAQAVIERSR